MTVKLKLAIFYFQLSCPLSTVALKLGVFTPALFPQNSPDLDSEENLSRSSPAILLLQ